MKRLLAALLVVVAAVAGAPTVAAQSDDGGVIGDLLDGDDDGAFASAQAYVGGFIDRVFADETDESAAEAAQQAQTTFNGNASAMQAWVNNRTTASTGYDVIKFTFEIEDESATVYLTANTTADGYRNASMVDATDRTVDESCTLEGHAARQADAELATFADEFAQPGENVTNSYLAGLAGEYSGDVECTFETETEDDS